MARNCFWEVNPAWSPGRSSCFPSLCQASASPQDPCGTDPFFHHVSRHLGPIPPPPHGASWVVHGGVTSSEWTGLAEPSGTPLPSQASPPALCPQGRTPDLEALLAVMGSAQEFIYASVMEYFPTTRFSHPRR